MSPRRLGAAIRHVRRIPEVLRCYSSAKDPWILAAGYTGISEFPLPYAAHFHDGTRYELQEFYDLETLWQVYFHRVYEVAPADRCVIDAGQYRAFLLLCSQARATMPGLCRRAVSGDV